LSDDGRHGLTLIVFVGSVFSPYYAWARRRGATDPVNHCSFNVALYGTPQARWSMTERGSHKVTRDENFLSIGPSSIYWRDDALEIQLDEICAPLPKRIAGTVRLWPTTLCDHRYTLGGSGRHHWCPFAPCARIEVELSKPRQNWRGIGYLDGNFGDEPLEDAFQSWNWSRASAPESTVVLYDYLARPAAPQTRAPLDGSLSSPATPPPGEQHEQSLALRFDARGGVEPFEPPPAAPLRTTAWGVARRTRSDAGTEARVKETLEDGPFYSRSLLETTLLGQPMTAFHESISLDRFRSRWVQCLLPFRMPRSPW
jgi:carotenoid 1,2-hydratase